MKRRLITIAIILIIALGLTSSALAQSYSFSLDKETVQVYWNSDGTLAIDYIFVFTNQPGAHAIDFVDVGLPNSSYDSGSISADVNGTPVSISSDYQGTGVGVAVDLGSQAIQPGNNGTVHVYIGRVSNVLYTDDQDKAYASGVFSPTYFGSQYVTGSTDLTVAFHLPPGVKPDEPRYHIPSSNWPGAQDPQTALDSNGRVLYTWQAQADAYTQYKFGASFPQSYIPASAIVRPSIWQTLGISSTTLFNCACFSFFGFLFFGIPVLTAVGQRRRKLQYLPPKISIEGHGIKRGLTAVEAGILMQEPLDKVMTMILFGVIKKNAAEVITREPLKLKVASPLPDDLHPYEKQFLEAFQVDDLKKRRDALQEMTVALIKSVQEKMKGFSSRESLAYYKNIMERAWQQIEAADTPEVKSQKFDEALEWTMLDKNYDDRTRRVFTGPVFVPMWWGRYDPGFGGAASAGSVRPSGMPAMTSTQGRGPSMSMPRLPGSDFAASMVGGVQTFSSKVIGDLTGFTSKVTNVTNPPPKPSTSSRGGWSSGGSGGCACACACAGCACACAGGGR
jgi:hypothetical protein